MGQECRTNIEQSAGVELSLRELYDQQFLEEENSINDIPFTLPGKDEEYQGRILVNNNEVFFLAPKSAQDDRWVPYSESELLND